MNLFNLYSWLTNLLGGAIDLLPQFIRNIIFKATLKELGKHTMIDYKTYIRYPSHIRIGNNTTINRGCRLIASYKYKEVEIAIGSHVAIGPEVCFFAAGHDYQKLELPDTADSITVDDYVWIGARSIILQGVHIGEGAIIGAGSIVTRDIPPFSVAIGIPARVLKKRFENI